MKNQGLVKINRSALAANYRLLQARIGAGKATAAAVKANAYGLGIIDVAPVFYESGCRTFFVATLEEGIALRTILPSPEIYVLSGPAAGTGPDYQAHALKPALNSLENIATARAEKIPACALHVDTGMNRLGLGADETQKLLSNMNLLEGLQIDLLMSHFACADEKNHPLTEQQYRAFKSIADHFPKAKKSLANSSGIFRNTDYHFDLGRPGMALYGLNPTPEEKNPMSAAVSLDANILQIRHAQKGESVGYAAGHILTKDSVIATISIGYADGFLRSLSGKGKLYWQGIACPILGRVSMDLTIIDLTHIPEGKRPGPGDMMEILGPHQSADDLANDAGTIGYEILTSLGWRYRRLYID